MDYRCYCPQGLLSLARYLTSWINANMALKNLSANIYSTNRLSKARPHLSHTRLALQKQSTMAKNVPFKAYELQRRHLHNIPNSPAKISQHRVDKIEWAERSKTGTRKVYNRRVKQKLVTTAASILREDSFEVSCLHCGRFGDDSEVSQFP